jgi:hypothetical protein
LVRRVDRTDCDAVDALREQIVDDALLVGGGAVGDAEVDLNAGNLFLGLLSSFAGDDPLIGRVVRHESQVFSAAGAVGGAGSVCRRSSGLAIG